LQIALVNEFDIVSRAEGNYVRSLVNLYRSSYDLPPVAGVELVPAQGEAQSSGGETDAGEEKVWKLPRPQYWHPQDQIVVLKLGLGDYGEQGVVLSAVRTDREEWEELLFCRVGVHSRGFYLERVEMIAQGKFNGRIGWGESEAG
jgi:hypothetical protein